MKGDTTQSSQSMMLGSGVGEEPDAQAASLSTVATHPLVRWQLEHTLLSSSPTGLSSLIALHSVLLYSEKWVLGYILCKPTRLQLKIPDSSNHFVLLMEAIYILLNIG